MSNKPKQEITTRIMTEADLVEVYDIECRAYQFPWQQSIFVNSVKKHFCLLAQVDNKIVGYAILSYVLDEASILNIVADPASQGRGVGSVLLQGLLDFAEQKGCCNIFLEVRESNTAAYQLYQKFYFDEVGVRKNYYPIKNGREDALILARAI